MKLVKFRAVKIGQEFFDPESGEDWVKTDFLRATMVSSMGDAISGEDLFGETEMVEIPDPE